ncbi:hypothetical protein D3C87_40140 [compost metagenome]
MLFIKRYQLLIPTFIVGVSMFFSCTKEKTPTPVTPEPTKWEKIAGSYKVYDTTGVYLYDMNLIHIHNDATNRDSIRFENFDGKFTFTTQQEEFNNYPMYVAIGFHNPIFDTNSKRWQLGGGADSYYNSYNNDTIPLKFQMTNINYYISDITPYYACNCKQIAVKQH